MELHGIDTDTHSHNLYLRSLLALDNAEAVLSHIARMSAAAEAEASEGSRYPASAPYLIWYGCHHRLHA